MAFTRIDLENKIKEIFGCETISPLIDTQIQKYVREHKWSYLDIARALYYFYSEQDGDITKARGIGIVPYVMEESKKFFDTMAAKKLKEQQEAEKLKQKEKIVIKCKKPEASRRKKNMIAIEKIGEDNNEQ